MDEMWFVRSGALDLAVADAFAVRRGELTGQLDPQTAEWDLSLLRWQVAPIVNNAAELPPCLRQSAKLKAMLLFDASWATAVEEVDGWAATYRRQFPTSSRLVDPEQFQQAYRPLLPGLDDSAGDSDEYNHETDMDATLAWTVQGYEGRMRLFDSGHTCVPPGLRCTVLRHTRGRRKAEDPDVAHTHALGVVVGTAESPEQLATAKQWWVEQVGLNWTGERVEHHDCGGSHIAVERVPQPQPA